MRYEWSVDKNVWLIRERGIGFEDVMVALKEGCLLDTILHPNQESYPHQRIHIVAIDGYAYLVPFVEDDEKIFLKTIISSRKATQQYLSSKI